jgi:hypothetical protein
MKQWEYIAIDEHADTKYVTPHYANTIRMLNYYGEQGWVLLTFKGSAYSVKFAVFKRQVNIYD